jgi:hypothetical protein
MTVVRRCRTKIMKIICIVDECSSKEPLLHASF